MSRRAKAGGTSYYESLTLLLQPPKQQLQHQWFSRNCGESYATAIPRSKRAVNYTATRINPRRTSKEEVQDCGGQKHLINCRMFRFGTIAAFRKEVSDRWY